MLFKTTAMTGVAVLLAGCGAAGILPSNLTPSTRADCFVLPQAMSYNTNTLIAGVHEIKPGIYQATVESKTGVFYAGEGYPLISRAKNATPGDKSPVYWYGGGIFIPHGAADDLRLFAYESMLLQEAGGKVINLGDPAKTPPNAEKVNFQNGPNGVLGNAIAGGLAASLRAPEGTVVPWTVVPSVEFRKTLLSLKASGDACKVPATPPSQPN